MKNELDKREHEKQKTIQKNRWTPCGGPNSRMWCEWMLLLRRLSAFPLIMQSNGSSIFGRGRQWKMLLFNYCVILRSATSLNHWSGRILHDVQLGYFEQQFRKYIWDYKCFFPWYFQFFFFRPGSHRHLCTEFASILQAISMRPQGWRKRDRERKK